MFPSLHTTGQSGCLVGRARHFRGWMRLGVILGGRGSLTGWCGSVRSATATAVSGAESPSGAVEVVRAW